MDYQFSAPDLVGHLSFLMLVLAMTMRSMWKLRVMVAASAILAITYDFFWLADPANLLWQGVLLITVLVMLALRWRAGRDVGFTEEERALLDTALHGLKPQDARRLLSEGIWASGKPGAALTEQGKPVLFLTWLAEGEADVICDAQELGHVHAGSFVGEMSLLEGTAASATVTLTTPARYWMIPAIKLRDLKRDEPEIWASVEAALSRDLGRKLREMNAGAVAG
ncbi:Crp/Fnr family transcriptional regulator [Aliiroseovarius sp.]|uniref:Crp/Fnr family transcriptional regulator n=1 Tax=Aliiroseovarius sp. TaxID=1872442 RepID=UPI003BA9CB36